jgi:hypothetical protein
MIHVGSVLGTAGTADSRHGFSSDGFWLDTNGKATLLTPGYTASTSNADSNAITPISPEIANPASSTSMAMSSAEPRDEPGVSSHGTDEVVSNDDRSTLGEGELPIQDNGSTTGESDSRTEDSLLATGEHRSGTEGDPLTSLAHAESVATDRVSPAVDAATKVNSARSA